MTYKVTVKLTLSDQVMWIEEFGNFQAASNAFKKSKSAEHCSNVTITLSQNTILQEIKLY